MENSAATPHPWLNRLKTIAATAVVGLEINPVANDLARALLIGGSLAVSRDPERAAMWATAATALYEVPGALGAAWLLGSDRGRDNPTRVNTWLTKINTKLTKNGVPPDPNIDPLTASVVAMVFGPPALMTVKQARSPERTVRQNVRYGTVASTLVSLAVGAEVYLVGKGIIDASPETIGVAGLSIAGIWYGVRKGLQRARQNLEFTK